MLKRLPLILLPLLLLGACANPTTDDSASLHGYYTSTSGDGFEVSSSLFQYYAGSFSGLGDKELGDYGYSGTIESLPGWDNAAGVLILKVTSAGSFGPTVGKYFAVSWKNLTEKGVSEAGAYKSGSTYNKGMDSLAAAKDEYTVANGYFGYYGEYTRQ